METRKERRPNRLAREKSPYLLQHAYNPVDWYAWGEEAFEKARREDRPIFLSVGYSTCHWCHVMERESFENEEIARLLNEHFVSIKVDREERPDVDRIYMTFVQATTGSGGWPMSVFLTPDLKPFFGGTYFPPDSRWGRPGFKDILERIAGTWKTDRARVVDSGAQVVEALRQEMAPARAPGATADEPALAEAYRRLASEFDPVHGGFGGAPKFPRPAALGFLLRWHARAGEPQALEMTLRTLRGMARGGMHDHLGGGFHRYSVDERWHVPHFEKMLYDQAQLAVSYLEAFQVTHEIEHGRVTRDILEYVLRGMTHPRGGFYSAEDADSAADPAKPEDVREGAFYVWEAAEIERLLGKPAAELFALRYGVEPGGNVHHDPHGEFAGKNVLYAALEVEEAAKRAGVDAAEAERLLAEARRRLLEARGKRPGAAADDKVIAAWNGLMISAFARAGAVLEEPRYVEAAVRAARFVLENVADPKSGDLRRRWREGEAAFAAGSIDYASLVQALLDLYEATFDVEWLRRAVALQERQIDKFWDDAGGGFWETAGDDPSLLLRMKEDYDGAEPASNSLSALNLLRLAQVTGRDDLRGRASRTLAAFAWRLKNLPQALPQMLAALDASLSKPRQVVIAGRPRDEDTRALLREVRSRFLPHTALLLADGGKGQEELARTLAFLRTVKPLEGRATAYVCENYACDLPTSDPATMARLLDRGRPRAGRT